MSFKYSLKKLTTAIFQGAAIYYFYQTFGQRGQDDPAVAFLNYFGMSLDKPLHMIIGSFVNFAFGILGFIWIGQSIYRLGTFDQYIHTFEHKDVFKNTGGEPYTKYLARTGQLNGSYKNINSVLAYRNSLMNTMPVESASQLLLSTSSILGATANSNVLGYLDTKFSTMSVESGLEFLKNGRI
jgi:hypothetical protein